MRWKKLNYMLEIVILRNHLEQEKNEWPEKKFEGLGVQMTPK